MCVFHSSDRRKAIFFAFPFLPWNSRYQIHHTLLANFYLNSCFIHNLVVWFLPEDDPERFEICWRHNVLYIYNCILKHLCILLYTFNRIVYSIFGVDEKIPLKLNLKRWGVTVWKRFTLLKIQNVGVCEHGNEHSDSMEAGNFFIINFSKCIPILFYCCVLANCFTSKKKKFRGR
jgi:hypothetical protein